MEECKTLSVEEMEFIEDSFKKKFPNRKDFAVLHEIESEYVHSDIGILSGESCSTILFTMGMSCTIMDGGKQCEVFVELPKEAFYQNPTEQVLANGAKLNDIINPEYNFINRDLIDISKMPAIDGDLYKDTDTISTSGNIYALRKIFKIGNIDCFYLAQLSLTDFGLLGTHININRKEFLSERVKPIKPF